MFRLLIPRDRRSSPVPSLTRGATVPRLHHLWWASRPMVTPLKTQVQIIGSTRPGVPRSPLADARGYGSASSSPLVGRQAHGHSLAVAGGFKNETDRTSHQSLPWSL